MPYRSGEGGRCWNPGGPLGVPGADYEDEPGVRPPLVDPDDPAIIHIGMAAMQLARFGFDPHDADIARRAVEVGRRDYDRDPDVVEKRRIQELERRQEERRLADPWAIGEGEVVYYMRIGDRVKIGWSTNLPKRLGVINPEELMVTEPGNRLLERARHDQFAELRTHGEWFRLEDRLTSHIEELRRLDREAS